MGVIYYALHIRPDVDPDKYSGLLSFDIPPRRQAVIKDSDVNSRPGIHSFTEMVLLAELIRLRFT